jgi:uncharacterized protein
MPRPKLRRRVRFNPKITYFKPAGIPLKQLKEVIINHDELEALRLKNNLNLDQKEVAKRMNVSQPTLHRILLSAKEKITEALVKGKAIKIEKRGE